MEERQSKVLSEQKNSEDDIEITGIGKKRTVSDRIS